MVESLDLLENLLDKITLPVLLVHGSEDNIVPVYCSEHLYERISSTDKIFEASAIIMNYYDY